MLQDSSEPPIYVDGGYYADRQFRRRIVTTIAPGVIGVLVFILSNNERVLYNFSERLLIDPVVFIFAAVALLVTSFMFTAIWYLQTGFRRDAEFSALEFETFSIGSSPKGEEAKSELSEISIALDNKIDSKISALEGEVNSLRSEVGEIIAGDIDAISKDIASQIQGSIPTDIVNNIYMEIGRRYNANARSVSISKVYDDGISRLRMETSSLMRRGNINLILGGTTTLGGLVLLGFFISAGTAPDSPIPFALYYIPKVTIVIFIQVFAFFFLRLYKVSLAEIKYFQNEISNMELRYMALIASEGEQPEVRGAVVVSYSSTERNPPPVVSLASSAREKDLVNGLVEITKSISSNALAKHT